MSAEEFCQPTARKYAPFVDGMQDDVFWHDAPETKGGGADVAIAQVWPGPTAFPDFLHLTNERPSTRSFLLAILLLRLGLVQYVEQGVGPTTHAAVKESLRALDVP